MKEPVKCTEEEYRMHRGAYDGLCLHCGTWSGGGVEPDAEGYFCEGCGEKAVCGVEQALIAGNLEVAS